jgi:hypothetical protein
MKSNTKHGNIIKELTQSGVVEKMAPSNAFTSHKNVTFPQRKRFN